MAATSVTDSHSPYQSLYHGASAHTVWATPWALLQIIKQQNSAMYSPGFAMPCSAVDDAVGVLNLKATTVVLPKRQAGCVAVATNARRGSGHPCCSHGATTSKL